MPSNLSSAGWPPSVGCPSSAADISSQREGVNDASECARQALAEKQPACRQPRSAERVEFSAPWWICSSSWRPKLMLPAPLKLIDHLGVPVNVHARTVDVAASCWPSSGACPRGTRQRPGQPTALLQRIVSAGAIGRRHAGLPADASPSGCEAVSPRGPHSPLTNNVDRTCRLTRSPRHWLAINVGEPWAIRVTRGYPNAQLRASHWADTTDFQADSASSTLVTRSTRIVRSRELLGLVFASLSASTYPGGNVR